MDFDIGTPGQTLHVLLDSGSDWFWVTADECKECGGVMRYNRNSSSTYELIDKDGVKIDYGSGSLGGDLIQETICLSTARACEGNFCRSTCANDMNIVAVNYQDEGLQSLMSDGLVGLAPRKIGDERPDLFIEKAYEQGEISNRVYSLAFAGDFEDSYVTFGGYDTSEFAVEDITWHDNIGKYFWAVELNQVRYGNDTIAEYGDSYSWFDSYAECVIDSGSSYILMPEGKFYALYNTLNDKYDCDIDWYNTMTCYLEDWYQYEDLPEMEVQLSGKTYRIPRESLYTKEENGGIFFSYPFVTVEVTYISGWDEWILGLTFLENYYVVYDMEHSNIGFALSKTSSMAPSDSGYDFYETSETAMLSEIEAASSSDMTTVIGCYAAIGAVVLGGAYAARRLFKS